MIDGLYSALEQHPAKQQATPQKTLRMVQNERMAGSVPMWQNNKNPVETSLTQATNANEYSAPESALAYKAPETGTYNEPPQEFGFADLIDMVNPLHHVPVVGQVYREITGDEIKPIGQIMGGALFGGPLGAASGLINVVIEEETGKDMTENAVALVLNGKTPQFRTHDELLSQGPETRLAAAEVNTPSSQTPNDIPGNLLAFVDMKSRPEIIIERTPAAEGRTAGNFAQKSYPELSAHAATVREPITQVRFSTYRIND